MPTKSRPGSAWAATFLAQQHVYVDADVPYRSQLVPLAAIHAALGSESEVLAADKKLRQWFWCGVLGELYGSAIETRFARDLEQVVDSVRRHRSGRTVQEANFRQARLLTLRTGQQCGLQGHLRSADARWRNGLDLSQTAWDGRVL